MTPLEAIEKYDSFIRVTATFDGVRLWSNGHILIPADYAGEEKYNAGNLWSAHLKRDGETELNLGRCIAVSARVYRNLESSSLSIWIDEAYRQVCQMDGAVPYGVATNKAIAFRVDGNLVSLCMPVKTNGSDGIACEPTDELVWAAYATDGNGWYRQSIPALRERWTRELQKIQSDIRRAQKEVEELVRRAQEEVEELKIDAASIETRLAKLPA